MGVIMKFIKYLLFIFCLSNINFNFSAAASVNIDKSNKFKEVTELHPLVAAIKADDLRAVDKLLNEGISPNLSVIQYNGKPAAKFTPLMIAAELGKDEYLNQEYKNGYAIVQRLLEEPTIKIDALDQNGNNALSHSMYSLDPNITKLLLDTARRRLSDDDMAKFLVGSGDRTPLAAARGEGRFKFDEHMGQYLLEMADNIRRVMNEPRYAKKVLELGSIPSSKVVDELYDDNERPILINAIEQIIKEQEGLERPEIRSKEISGNLSAAFPQDLINIVDQYAKQSYVSPENLAKLKELAKSVKKNLKNREQGHSVRWR